jgi:hypothetical protein
MNLPGNFIAIQNFDHLGDEWKGIFVFYCEGFGRDVTDVLLSPPLENLGQAVTELAFFIELDEEIPNFWGELSKIELIFILN